MTENYYEILEVETTSSGNEIKKAYLKLALEYHPDKNLENMKEAEEKFKRINIAYKVLSNPEQRESYDDFLNNHVGDIQEFRPSFYSDFNISISEIKEQLEREMIFVKEVRKKYEHQSEQIREVREEIEK